jgi:hypothetical protein
LKGQSGSPITIRALNDGGALFDGQFVNDPVSFIENSWFVLEGFNAKSGNQAVIALASRIYFDASTGSHNNILRRIVAWDAHIAKNNAVITIIHSNNNLLEDIGIFGTGHIGLHNFFASGNVFRRVWSRFEGTISQAFQAAYYLAYDDGAGATCENCIANHSAESMPQEYDLTDQGGNIQSPIRHFTNYGGFRGGSLNTESSIGKAPCARMKMLGSLSYLIDAPGDSVPIWMTAARGDVCGTLKHVLSYVSPGYARFHEVRGFQIGDPSIGSPQAFSASNLTSIRSDLKGDGFTSGWSVTSVSAGSSLSAVASPWTTTGAGANLCNRWINSAVTSQPLWPWPMNERIKSATASAGAYAGPCPSCIGGRRARTATDVTAQVEAILGTIPSQCRSTAAPGPAPAPVPVASGSTTFKIGQRVQVNSLGPAVVRQAPGEGLFLGTQPVGTLGTISASPMDGSGYTWWKVDYDGGIDGWSTEGLLEPAPVPGPVIDTIMPTTTITSPANGAVVRRFQ